MLLPEYAEKTKVKPVKAGDPKTENGITYQNYAVLPR